MKKVISVFLAVLMLFSALGIVGVAEEKVTCSDPSCVSLVFNYMSYDIGTVYMGRLDKVTEDPNRGCYALRGDYGFTAGNFVQLPEIKNTDADTYGVWYLATATVIGEPIGYTLSGGSYYQIPETANNGEWIMFLAQQKPIETTSVIVKILQVFIKIIGLLIPGLDVELVKILGDLGLDMDM